MLVELDFVLGRLVFLDLGRDDAARTPLVPHVHFDRGPDLGLAFKEKRQSLRDDIHIRVLLTLGLRIAVYGLRQAHVADDK